MAVSSEEANQYIMDNCLQADYWNMAFEQNIHERFLNIAERTLKRQYPHFLIPDEAVYEFAAVLSVIQKEVNLGNKYQLQGIETLSVSGEVSYTFSNDLKSLKDLIPEESKIYIENFNGKSIRKRKTGKVI